eukprot:4494788-Amphidinium_carterae.1
MRFLAVYPCSPGYTRNTSSSDLTDCMPCPSGYRRDAVSLECLVCGPGSYGFGEGREECSVCDDSMNCTGSSNIGIPEAAWGWYRLNTSSTVASFFECDPSSNCLGGNTCKDHHVGFLCQRCEDGYGHFLNSAKKPAGCYKCSSDSLQYGIMCGIVVSYIFAISLLVCASNMAVPALSEVNIVILRVLVKQMQLLSAALLITGFAQWRDGGMAFETFGIQHVIWLSLEFFMNPWLGWLSLECLVADPYNAYQAAVLLGLFLLPAVFLVVLALTLLAMLMASFAGMMLPDNEWLPGSPRGGMRSPRSPKKNLRHAESVTSILAGRGERSDADDAFTSRYYSSMKSSLEQHKGQDTSDEVWMCHDEYSEDLRDTTLTLRQIGMYGLQLACICTFVFQPVALELLLMGCTCQLVDKPRLLANPDIVCFEGEHTIWYGVSQTAIQIYGVGLPALIMLGLYKTKDSFMKINTRRMFGFYFFGLEESQVYYYETLCMMRNSFFLLTTEIQDGFTRTIIAWPLSFVFLWVHMRAEPYDRRGFYVFQRLEFIGLLAISLSLTGRLFFEMAEVLSESGIRSRFLHDQNMRWAYITLCVVILAAMLPVGALGIVRNSITRRLYFEHECFKWPINGFIKLLFLLDEQHHGYMTLTPLLHELDISKLSHVEKRFLMKAIHDTVRRYISCQERKRFNLLHTLAAFRVAFERCARARYNRALVLMCKRLYPDAKLPGRDEHGVGASLSGKRTSRLSMMDRWRSRINEPRRLEDQELKDLKEMAAMVAHKGVLVEEWYMALMLEWRSIVKGDKQFYHIHSAEDPRNVLFEDKAVWDDNIPVDRFFQELAWRHGLKRLPPSAGGDSGQAVEAANADFNLLGLEHAEPMRPLLSEGDLQKLQMHHEL